jgi:hypothetical protein
VRLSLRYGNVSVRLLRESCADSVRPVGLPRWYWQARAEKRIDGRLSQQRAFAGLRWSPTANWQCI